MGHKNRESSEFFSFPESIPSSFTDYEEEEEEEEEERRCKKFVEKACGGGGKGGEKEEDVEGKLGKEADLG